jgi:hypothetical protein
MKARMPLGPTAGLGPSVGTLYILSDSQVGHSARLHRLTCAGHRSRYNAS